MHKLVDLSCKRKLGKVWGSDLPKGAMAMCFVYEQNKLLSSDVLGRAQSPKPAQARPI